MLCLVIAALFSACTAPQENAQQTVPPPTTQEAPADRPAAAGEVDHGTNGATPVLAKPAFGRDDLKSMPIEEARAELSARGQGAVALQAYPAGPPPAREVRQLKSAQPVVALDELERVVATPQDTERYQHQVDNPIKLVAEHPVSTFSIDVDTGSYANVRRFLNSGRLPPHDAVRVEEMINYFPYQYALPRADAAPFAVATELARAPWSNTTQLLRIGIKGKDIAKQSLPPANIVFLIDVSGSMDSPDKLPLLKSAMQRFTAELRAQDQVSMVVYAGASGLVLPPTPGNKKEKILNALEQLSAGGSTHGAAGIELAYQTAQSAYIEGGINRILLATDGDFNVGVTDFNALKNLVELKRKSGVALSTFGFGSGNYNDQLMEQLADVGNGSYSYIDNANEARKALVDEFSSTLATIAQDVKIQIEFNPATVAEYRLIGYENRVLKREDFNNDKIDAGEIGAGHTVTALYEIRLVGVEGSHIDPLRYARPETPAAPAGEELAFVRLRYKDPGASTSKLIEVPVQGGAVGREFAQASTEFRFAAAVAGFGQLLRGGKLTGDFDYADAAGIADAALGDDRFGYRAELVRLINRAAGLSTAQGHAVQQISRAAR
jgi:Ca-activated chloride channel family protein